MQTDFPGGPPGRLGQGLFWIAVAVCCAWILSLPLFPSQDGPLHLYYVNAFRQVLLHQPGVYSQAYSIRSYLPPYSTYYYGLIALGSVVSLETADKIFACLCVVLFAAGLQSLFKALALRTSWPLLLLTPVLLGWPLMMGFLSYLLGVDLALFAITFWCRAAATHHDRYRAGFLALLVLIVLTHAEPWAVAVGFAVFELACRVIFGRARSVSERQFFWRDLVTAGLACVPYAYLARFKEDATRKVDFVDYATHLQRNVPPIGHLEQFRIQWRGVTQAYGLLPLRGPGLALWYARGVRAVLFGSLLLAVWFLVRQRRSPSVYWQQVWVTFAVLFGASLLVIPENLGGGYFFSTRLQIVFFVACITAVSFGLERVPHLPWALSLGSGAFLAVALVLSIRHISPVAREIATLRTVPTVQAGSDPGLTVRPAGYQQPPLLAFEARYWGPVHYFRWHSLLLYNTPWLGDPIIPLRPRPEALNRLDSTFYNQNPEFRLGLLANEAQAKNVLDKVGFVIMMRQGVPLDQSPFAENPGDKQAGAFAAGWSCQTGAGAVWYLCQPPEKR
jgi:hypothetical protein